MTKKKIDSVHVAEQLFDYMTFRAARENQVHELDVACYCAHIEAGVRTFFGIAIGPDGLEADEQQPGLFREWKRRVLQ
jgi:hypothetical protein